MIRPAAPGDAAAIAAIWNRVIRDTAVTFTTEEKTASGLEELIATAPAFLVAETDGTVRGFANYGAFRSGPGYARTAELTVIFDPAATGHGQGKALVSALEGLAREGGITAMVAGVSGENPRAAAFFEREGYVRQAVMPAVGHKFGRYLDLILLQKMLKTPR